MMPTDNAYEEAFFKIIIPFYNYFEKDAKNLKTMEEIPKYLLKAFFGINENEPMP